MKRQDKLCFGHLAFIGTLKSLFTVIFILGLIMVLIGCVRLQKTAQPTAEVEETTAVVALLPYSGPKARIAVADFEVKAVKATGEIGSGLREILITALINSHRFLVVERQALSAIMQEQKLSASDVGHAGSEPQRGKIKTAELIITAAVTEFEPQSSGGAAGVGGGGGVGSGMLGGILGVALNKAHMALDIRIVDTFTSEVLAATRVQGQASDIGGAIMAGLFGKHGLGAGLSAYANTPMEKAIRICIIEAVRYISQSIPPAYYKF